MNEPHHGAIWVDLNSKGRLCLSGRDRIALIHRMSTNDLNRLSDGKGMLTVLTTPVGRIIDVLTVLHDGKSAIAITGEGRSERIRAYFQRNIFFNDQVKVTDWTNTTRLYGLYGTQAAAILKNFAAVDGLADHDFVKQDGLYFIRAEPLAGGGFWLMGPPEKTEALRDDALAVGAVMADRATYELLCIEAGYPIAQNELTEDYIPLEAGLWHAVSFTKGCYTGQEIIARMESRGKLAKTLVRLATEEPLEKGTPLFQQGASVGTLTSIAPHPAGGFVGLGFVKTAALNENTPITSNGGVTVKVLGIAGTQPER